MSDDSADIENAGATIVVLAMAVGLWMVLVHALNWNGAAASAARRGPDVFEWLALAAGVAIQCVSVLIVMRLSRALRSAAAIGVAVAGGTLVPMMVDGTGGRYNGWLAAACFVWMLLLLAIAARGLKPART